jgi:hypothetical protein
MRGIRVVLFINLLLWTAYAATDLFFPEYLVKMNLGQDAASARHVGAIATGLAVAIWYAFRKPAENVGVINALIVLNVVDLLVGVGQSVAGIETWNNTTPGIVMNTILGAGLIIFRPKTS